MQARAAGGSPPWAPASTEATQRPEMGVARPALSGLGRKRSGRVKARPGTHAAGSEPMTVFSLIGNNGFTTDDHPQPELWAEVLSAAGLRQFEYFADHLEPVIFRRVVAEESEFFQATRRALERFGLSVFSGATARVSYLLNMLSHPYPDMRRAARDWMRAFIDLTRGLGGRFISGHYDLISLPEATRDLKAATDRLVEELLLVSAYAREAGLRGIFLEVMHRRQLQPYTIAGTHQLIDRLNQDAQVPFHVHLDTGHMAFIDADPDHTAQDRDVYRWLATPFGLNHWLLLHAQQTDAFASRHWPFTPGYNRIGIIDPRRVIQAIEESGVGRAVIALEILYPRSTPLERIRSDILTSAQYWRDALESRGYQRHHDDSYQRTSDDEEQQVDTEPTLTQ